MAISRQRLLAKPPSRPRFGSATTGVGEDWELAVSRIQLLAWALIGFGVFQLAVGLVLFKLVPEFFAGMQEFGPANLVWVALPAAALLAFLRLPRPSIRVRLFAGISFVLLVAVMVSAGEVAQAWWLDGARVHRLPWVSIWLLLVPLVVPLTSPRAFGRLLLLSGLPTAVLFAGVQWFDVPRPPPITYLDYFLPCFMLSVLGALVARMMYRLTQRVREVERMGSYYLEERIGSGGMGEVWRARHHMLVRPAAVKLVRPEKLEEAAPGTSAKLVERFQLEAQATASLRSPHTVELYDFGVTDEGTFFYVMELLDGLDLEKLVERFGPLPPARVVYLMSQVCDSLADAHEAGLLHRDIKPANLYACRAGRRFDFVKVLDFGLVRWTAVSRESLVLTADQTILGTPAFMAPEVAAGEPVDHRLDIYSVGCVCYWLLTGGLVFEKDTALALALAHVNETPTPPSVRSEYEVPPELDRLVLDCLAKRPEDRPGSADEVAARLGACGPADSWSNEQARRWWRTHLPSVDDNGPASPSTLDQG